MDKYNQFHPITKSCLCYFHGTRMQLHAEPGGKVRIIMNVFDRPKFYYEAIGELNCKYYYGKI